MIMTVSRLVPQKGIDLIQGAILKTLELGGQYVLLGSSPIPEVQDSFWRLKMQLASYRQAHLHLVPNEQLTHWMFGSADFNLIPSIFEPCGLTQLIGLRYGAIPVVRETGGLKDTVFEMGSPSSMPTWELSIGF
jgi:glycogen synthase